MRRRARDREDLLEAEVALALRGRECPVCVLTRETERAVVTWLATTNIREEATIRRLVAARGLCAAHWSKVLERRAGDLGSSGARVLSRIAEAASNDFDDGPGVVPPRCPVCGSLSRRARSVLAILFTHLSGPDSVPRLVQLCRPHLRLASELAPDHATFEALASMHRRSLLALADHLHARADDLAARRRLVRRLIRLLTGGTSPTDHLPRPNGA